MHLQFPFFKNHIGFFDKSVVFFVKFDFFFYLIYH